MVASHLLVEGYEGKINSSTKEGVSKVGFHFCGQEIFLLILAVAKLIDWWKR